MEQDFSKMRKKELDLLIIEFNKGSQVDRSLGNSISAETKKKFRETLLSEIVFLMGKVDDESLKNEDIRNSIRKIKNVDEAISFGQAQKVVNVSLKQYCFVTNKNENILKELDCPLDRTTMKGCKIKHNNMKNVDEEDYKNYQKRFEEDGARIFRDILYDCMRISNFKNLKEKQNENN
jgi:hypothetical protein